MEDLFTISQIAKEIGISVSWARQLADALGIQPVETSPQHAKLYAPSALERIRAAHNAARRGPKSKLTPDDVREIRRMYRACTPLSEVAAKYGISIPYASRIAKRLRRGDVDV